MKLQSPLMSADFTMANMPREFIRDSTSPPNYINLGSSNAQSFGNFKSLYNPKFNLTIMAHWRRLDAPKVGWGLHLGVRSSEGIYATFNVVEFDYSNLGVSNVLTELPDVYPEALLMQDSQGGIYVLGAYPDPGSRPLSGASGPGRIDNPYCNIAMAYWGSDNFDDLYGANYETVWNGAASQTQLRFLSAPDSFPSGDSSTIRSTKLFFCAVDSLNDPNGQIIVYRD